MRNFSEKIDDLRDFIQNAKNNFALVAYDTKEMRQIILSHLKPADACFKTVNFKGCHLRAYMERFKSELADSEKISTYLLINLEEIIPADQKERIEWASLFNLNREGFNDGDRNTVFLLDQSVDDLFFHHAKDIYSWFLFRLSFINEENNEAMFEKVDTLI